MIYYSDSISTTFLLYPLKNKPRYEKTVFFFICENKDADQISALVFATRKVQSFYYLNPTFQASSHLLWLYSPVCVGPGRKPRRPVFSQRGSNYGHYPCSCPITFFFSVGECGGSVVVSHSVARGRRGFETYLAVLCP